MNGKAISTSNQPAPSLEAQMADAKARVRYCLVRLTKSGLFMPHVSDVTQCTWPDAPHLLSYRSVAARPCALLVGALTLDVMQVKQSEAQAFVKAHGMARPASAVSMAMAPGLHAANGSRVSASWLQVRCRSMHSCARLVSVNEFGWLTACQRRHSMHS